MGFPGILNNCETCHVTATSATTTYNTVPLNALPSRYEAINADYAAGIAGGTATTAMAKASLATMNDTDAVTTPFTASCVSCHDHPAAKAHMTLNGGLINVARSCGRGQGRILRHLPRAWRHRRSGDGSQSRRVSLRGGELLSFPTPPQPGSATTRVFSVFPHMQYPIHRSPLCRRSWSPAARPLRPATPKPRAGSAPTAASAAQPATPAPRPKLVDINSASAAELKTLPGIGDAEAKRIVANRPYLTKSHLVTKKVLDLAAYDALRGRIVAVQPQQPKPKPKS